MHIVQYRVKIYRVGGIACHLRLSKDWDTYFRLMILAVILLVECLEDNMVWYGQESCTIMQINHFSNCKLIYNHSH